MKEYKKIIPIICCLLLMLVKVSALHVYTHQSPEKDLIENCNICDLAIESQQNELTTPTKIQFKADRSFLVITTGETKYQNNDVESISTFQLFSRPPPKV